MMLISNNRKYLRIHDNSKPTLTMKPLYTFLLIFLSNLTFGQFAIISDKDGYSNIRSSAETENTITDKLENGHLIYCFENKGNWINIDYTKNNKELNGKVYKDRVKLISDYKTIPQQSETANSVVYAKDSVKIIVTQQKFDKNKYRFCYYKDAEDQIELINGKRYWGTDGEEPSSAYKSILIYIGKKKINLPPTALENLFEPSLYNTQINYDSENNILYIQSMNSDGAGSYEVIWKIEKGIYKIRYVAYGF
jgi:hypothetical protein